MEWQPIETAPKDGTVFLAWDMGPELIRWSLGDWVKRDDSCEGGVHEDVEPTHWMPLPLPLIDTRSAET